MNHCSFWSQLGKDEVGHFPDPVALMHTTAGLSYVYIIVVENSELGVGHHNTFPFTLAFHRGVEHLCSLIQSKVKAEKEV